MQVIIGADPGISGAIAMLVGDRVKTFDLPVWAPTGKKNTIDCRELQDNLEYIVVGNTMVTPIVHHIFLEQGQSMPNQSSVAGFNYGRACGLLEAALYLTFPHTVIHYVMPGVWKRKMGLLKQEKTASLDMARRLFPVNTDQFKRKKDHNRAEAALIAYYGTLILNQD